MKARITVYPRREVLDPQGKAIHQALHRLGFDEVAEVRAGKSFEIDLAARSADAARKRLEAMCEKLLANKIMESYTVEVGVAKPAKPAKAAKPKVAKAGKATTGKPAKAAKAAKPRGKRS
ncbi:MAG TPA: phosphoribosylformylglycinamidine synthase subunit PurS [Thermoanaerobaculia bacterium]|nr:phosphoribosylformylglycinamidine synthase subunit PurS [Thermoanaerobaculia bacterium]